MQRFKTVNVNTVTGMAKAEKLKAHNWHIVSIHQGIVIFVNK
jgi:hypothetical protein